MLFARPFPLVTLTFLAACGTTATPPVNASREDATVLVDVPVNPTDQPVDRGDAPDPTDAADAARDLPVDGPTIADASPDLPADVAPDARADVVADVPVDAPVDVPVDIATDSPPPMDVLADVVTDAGGFVPIPGASCNARERNVPVQESPHVDPDAGAVVYLTNPPASGPHFGTWTRWGAWPAVPRGYWVHNLEHGGVAFLYRCPAGLCETVRDALVSMTATIPADPACMPTDAEPARVRVVVTRDNEITTPIAAAAWGWLYAADCVDAPSLRGFYTRHAGMAPEDFCFDGSYP